MLGVGRELIHYATRLWKRLKSAKNNKTVVDIVSGRTLLTNDFVAPSTRRVGRIMESLIVNEIYPQHNGADYV